MSQALSKAVKVKQKEEQSKMQRYITKAFKLAARQTDRIAEAVATDKPFMVAFNGHSGSFLSDLARINYPTTGFTREMIEQNEAFIDFQEKLGESGIIVDSLATVEGGQFAYFGKAPAQAEMMLKARPLAII